MDRISALRNVEDAIRAFENGEADLADTEQRVATVLRTYATEFDSDDRRAYRVIDGPGEGRVVVAGTPEEACEQAVLLADASDGTDASDVTVELL
jgi:translation elongation factor EF-4